MVRVGVATIDYLGARRVLTATQVEAARLWRSDHDAARRDVVAQVAYGRRQPGRSLRDRCGGFVMDERLTASRRFTKAAEALQEFHPVCRAVVLDEQTVGEWARLAGVAPAAAVDRLRLGLDRLSRYYQVRAEVA